MSMLAILKRKSRTWVPHAVVAVLQLTVLFAFAGNLAAMHGFPLDDAWIHQVVARTFAASGTLGYVAGHHGAAATSYLWAALLAINFRVVHADPVNFTLTLNALFTLGAGQCLLALMLRDAAHARVDADTRARASEDGRIATLKTIVVVALATLGGNFVWFAFSGMEASLFVFLSLAAIAAATSGATNATPKVIAGVCAGALALTRPEAALLGPLLVIAAFAARRDRREALLIGAPWLAGIALYVGSNLARTGTAAPATLTGRRWLWLEDSGMGWPAQVVEYFDAWLLRLREYTLGTSANVAFWISLGCAALGALCIVRGKNTGMKLLLAWALAHLVTYAVILPTPGHAGRYQPLTPLVYLLLVGIGAMDLLDVIVPSAVKQRAPRSAAVVIALVAVAPWFGLVGVGVRDWRADHTKAVAHVRATEVGLGPVIDALPKDARVASFDIGGSGFFAQRTITDIGGLVDASAVPLMKQGRIWEYLHDQHVDYVVLPMGYAPFEFPDPINFGQRLHLLDNPAVELELVRVLGSPPHVWGPGIRSTANASPRQTVYRITYTGRPGPLPVAPPSATGWTFVDEGGLVARADRDPLKHGLAVLAGYGVHIRLEIAAARNAETKSAADEWTVQLGPWGVVASPPMGSTVPADAISGLMSDWLEPYIEARDSGGAARIALHAVAAGMRRFVDARFHPSLPPGRIVETGEESAPRTTSIGGLALVALVVGVGLVARRRRDRETREVAA